MSFHIKNIVLFNNHFINIYKDDEYKMKFIPYFI